MQSKLKKTVKKLLSFDSFLTLFRCEKMTKINILHVAINYIRALESIMETGDAGIQIYGTSVVQSPHLPISPEVEQPCLEKIANKNPIKSINSKKATRTTGQKETGLKRSKNPSSSSSHSSEDSGIHMLEENDEEEEEEDECPDWTQLTSTLELFPVNHRGNMDTLLSSTNIFQPQVHKQNSILQPKDLNSRSNAFDLDLMFNNPLILDTDLNSSFDSLESNHTTQHLVPFEEEDPFQLVF